VQFAVSFTLGACLFILCVGVAKLKLWDMVTFSITQTDLSQFAMHCAQDFEIEFHMQHMEYPEFSHCIKARGIFIGIAFHFYYTYKLHIIL